MKKVIKYIGIVIILCSLVGCGAKQLMIEELDFTNIKIIDTTTNQEVILDNEESKAFIEQLTQYTYKKKGKKKIENTLYEIHLLKGTSQLESVQIVDIQHIIYQDKLYKSTETLDLESIKDIVEQKFATTKAMANEAIEEKIFKVAHSDARICIYISKETEQSREKIEYVMIECNGQKSQYKDFEAYFDKLIWIEEETKAILAYDNNEGKNFMLIDMATCQLGYKGELDYLAMNEGFELQGEGITAPADKVNSFSLSYEDISKDGKKIMMKYSLLDEMEQEQCGSFWYELETGKISGIIKEYHHTW